MHKYPAMLWPGLVANNAAAEDANTEQQKQQLKQCTDANKYMCSLSAVLLFAYGKHSDGVDCVATARALKRERERERERGERDRGDRERERERERDNNTACECIATINILHKADHGWQNFMRVCTPDLTVKLCQHLEPLVQWYAGLVKQVEDITAAKPIKSNQSINPINQPIKRDRRGTKERAEREREIDDQTIQRRVSLAKMMSTTRGLLGRRSSAASSAPVPASFYPSSMWHRRARN